MNNYMVLQILTEIRKTVESIERLWREATGIKIPKEETKNE